jgi:hypothetical protein
MKLNSKNLVHELKYFIAKGNSYEASVGEKDDLIDAMLLIIRMVQHISQWDDELQNQMSGDVGGRFEDEPDMPLPMLVL